MRTNPPVGGAGPVGAVAAALGVNTLILEGMVDVTAAAGAVTQDPLVVRLLGLKDDELGGS